MKQPLSERSSFYESPQLFLHLLSMLVGVLVVASAVAFMRLIKFFQWLVFGDAGSLVPVISGLPWWLVVGGPAIGGLVVGLVFHFLLKEKAGLGVPTVMEAVAQERSSIPAFRAVVKFFCSALTIGSGGAAGREGPIVQIGALLGSFVGRLFRVTDEYMRILVACGAAGAISATFNAPITGVIFAEEIILGEFTLMSLAPIVLSSVVGAVFSREILGNYEVIHVPAFTVHSPLEVVWYLALGLLAGVVAAAFTVSLYKSRDFWDFLRIPPYIKPAIGGLAVGAIGLHWPQVMGLGYDAISTMLSGWHSLSLVLCLLALKMVATSLTLGSGGSGGIYAPSFFIGAMTGAAFNHCVNLVFPGITAGPEAYSIVGMGAVLAGTTLAPIQAFVIILEMTQNYVIVVPLIVCCLLSSAVARRIQGESIYTLQLWRQGTFLQAGKDMTLLQPIKAGDVMTCPTESIPESWTLRQMLRQLVFRRHSCFPVTDDCGNLTGVISLRDLTKVPKREADLDSMLVKEIASEPALSVLTDDDLPTVWRRMRKAQIRRAPVVEDCAGFLRLMGMLSQTDILSAYRRAQKTKAIEQVLPLGRRK